MSGDGRVPKRAWECLWAVVGCLIASFVLLEEVSLSDGWRGALEFLAAIAAIAAVAAWVWTNRTVLQEHEWRQRRHGAGQWRR